MKTKYALALGMVVGFGLCAGAIEGLKAQGTPRIGAGAHEGPQAQEPPAYVIAEVTINDNDKDHFMAEFFPAQIKATEKAGGTYVVIDGKPISLRGAPPGDHVVILRFEDMAKARAWYNSPGRKAADEIGDKYAIFRIFAVSGITQ